MRMAWAPQVSADLFGADPPRPRHPHHSRGVFKIDLRK
jgi:hypothetical protein